MLHCRVSDFRIVKSACRPIAGIKSIDEKKKKTEDEEENDEDEEIEGEDEDDSEILPTKTAGMIIVPEERMRSADEDTGPFILYTTVRGKGKVTPANSCQPPLSRPLKASRCMKFKKGDDDSLATITLIDRIADDVTDEILLSTTGGISNRISVKDLPRRSASDSIGAAIIIKLGADDGTLKSANFLSSEVVSELA